MQVSENRIGTYIMTNDTYQNFFIEIKGSYKGCNRRSLKRLAAVSGI